MSLLHPDDQCGCARPRGTGSVHFGHEKCRLCGHLIVADPVEKARLAELEAERRAQEREFDLRQKEIEKRRGRA